MKRLVLLSATLALAAACAISATGASARTTRGGKGAPTARAAQGAVVPADGATYDAGTEFTLPCISPTPRPDLTR
jgi:hypothetical protein